MVQIIFSKKAVTSADPDIGLFVNEKRVKFKNTLAYFPNTWSDEGYFVTYDCYYFKGNGVFTFIGKAKVFNLPFLQQSRRNAFSTIFPCGNKLSKQDFKTIGGAFSYYSRLRKILKNEYIDVLKRVKDAFVTAPNYQSLSNILKSLPSSRSLLDANSKLSDILLSSSESRIIKETLDYLQENRIKFNRTNLLADYKDEIAKIKDQNFSDFLESITTKYIEIVDSYIFFSSIVNYYKQYEVFINDDVRKLLQRLRIKYNDNISLKFEIDEILQTDSDSILNIVNEIKQELILSVENSKNIELGHFTSLDIYKQILEVDSGKIQNNNNIINSDLRLTNANQLNDPLEGKALYHFFNLLPKKDVYEQSNIYMICATTNLDSLPMWEQYGNHSEGISVTFTSNLIEEIITKSRANIYKVCYLYREDDKIKILGLEEKKSKKIEKLLESLRTTVHDYEDTEKLFKILDEIKYLFKKSDYAYENEYRIVLDMDTNKENFDIVPMNNPRGSLPFLYVYLNNLDSEKYYSVRLGPKSEDIDYIAPYLLYLNPKLQVSKSEIDFR